ncbi:large conductance mechanosensitive channel protein MscL [Knoellia sp. p5-6-4]|uniref:large conductance mechanosensitive channel protein MscL n=1 Tax=unclassified Knoellia TaxID=2618719 RepID=UPI0023DC1C86|nr:large conductance mechanosensitive channel protein MscL [Knoellia sp. p5-6-4]MDF2146785.1 large conductance mechanosensitive channel protein MscL [Knoellia sp. p5-6-4]
MKGFRDFVMRGNLVELAVAFVMGAAFATVVTAFTAMLMSLLGKVGGQPDFDNYRPGGVPVGVFLTALVSFIIIAAVVYFFVVKPYEAARERFVRQEEDAAPPEDVQLLREIRDLLAGRPTGTM